MVVLLSVLQTVGTSPCPGQILCPTRYRKQVNCSIIDLLIATQATQNHGRQTLPHDSFSSFLLSSIKFWGSLSSWTLRRRMGMKLFVQFSKVSDSLKSPVGRGLLSSVKEGRLPCSAPASVLAFCLHYCINHPEAFKRGNGGMEMTLTGHFLTWQFPALPSRRALMISCFCLWEDVGWRHLGKTDSIHFMTDE